MIDAEVRCLQYHHQEAQSHQVRDVEQLQILPRPWYAQHFLPTQILNCSVVAAARRLQSGRCYDLAEEPPSGFALSLQQPGMLTTRRSWSEYFRSRSLPAGQKVEIRDCGFDVTPGCPKGRNLGHLETPVASDESARNLVLELETVVPVVWLAVQIHRWIASHSLFEVGPGNRISAAGVLDVDSIVRYWSQKQ